jgi:DNA-3-methyladenine glycosylase
VTSAATARAAGPTPAVQPVFVTDRAWFDRSALEVAPDLLGMLLVHDGTAGRVVGRIVEVEAYLGPEDLASHAARGRTPRNATTFGEPGRLYVYLIYGMHHCLNVVTGPGRKPEAVLLRAAEIVEGEELARRRRGEVASRRLAAGPGNLAAAYDLDRRLDGADLLEGPVRLAFGQPPSRIVRTPRIGMTTAGDWTDTPLRFVIADDPHRSR